MDAIFLLGRILFAVLFVSSGLFGHLGEGGRQGRAYAKSMGAPAPDLLVPLSGFTIIAGGLMVALGLWGDLGALLILGFLVSITPIMHAFWKMPEGMDRQIQMVMFMKNLGLAGAALIVFWVFSELEDPPLTLTDSLF